MTRTIRFVSLTSALAAIPIPFPGIIVNKNLITISRQYSGIKFNFKIPSTDGYIAARIKEVDPKILYKGSVADLRDLLSIVDPKPNDCYLVSPMGELYVWKYNPETFHLAWLFYSKNFFLEHKENEEPYLEMSLDIAPLLSHKTLDETPGAPTFRKWLIPATWQPGIFEGFPESFSSEYGNQMTFYMGMQNDSHGNPYPTASPAKEVYDDSVPSVISLCVANSSGTDVYTKYYKSWMEWLAYHAKPVTYYAVLSPAQLYALKLDQTYFFNNTGCLIKEIRVNILTDSLSICEIDVYTLA